MSDTRRADPFNGDIDISGFAPAAPKKPQVQKEVIREVSEQNNFPSRAPARASATLASLPRNPPTTRTVGAP